MKRILFLFALIFLPFLFSCSSSAEEKAPDLPAEAPEAMFSFKQKTQDAHRHHFLTVILKEATCAEEGVKRRSCSICGEMTEEAIPKTAHSYQLTLEKATSCTGEGVSKMTCTVCGETRYEAIPKSPHTYQESVIKKATCKETGKSVFTCTVCGDTRTETVPVSAHRFRETVEKSATCKETGTVLKTCAICGQIERETIPLAEHRFLLTSGSEATCTRGSENLVYTCSVCGEKKEEKTPALGHTVSDGVCGRCGALCGHGVSIDGTSLARAEAYRDPFHRREFIIKRAEVYSSSGQIRCRGVLIPSENAEISDSIRFFVSGEGSDSSILNQVRTLAKAPVAAGEEREFNIFICDWSFLTGRSEASFVLSFSGAEDPA